MERLIIRNGRLLDIAGHAAPPADILIIGDSIAEIGPPGLAAPADAVLLDATDRLMMPGLINAHTHGHGHLGKGVADLWSLELLLNSGGAYAANRTIEDKELACTLGALDMIRHGTTACYDLFLELPLPTEEGIAAAARGYARAGLRAVIAPMVADRTFYEAIPGLVEGLPPPLQASVARFRVAPQHETIGILRDMARRWSSDRDRVRLALAPTIPLHCSDEFLLGCRDLAEAHGLAIQMHLAESRVQALSGPRRYGTSLTGHLKEIGLLGPHFTAAHGIWLDGADIAMLAEAGAGVAHNPGSNLRLGSGIAPVREMRECGMDVGIGTDGAQSADHQNMFEAVRMASLVSRIRTPDYRRWIRTEEALAMATVGSARRLGFEGRLGRIAPGYLADILFLDLGSLSLVPLNDPVNQLVHVENGASVASVMIGGRIVYRDGEFPGIDLAPLRARAEARAVELAEANAGALARAQDLEDAVGHFCIGLARQPLAIERTAWERPA